MPVKECQEGNKPGFKWGDEGKCYTYTEGDEAGKQEAHDKAAAQGAAIEANKNKESINSNMAIDIKNLTGKTQTREFTFKVSEESSINEDERTVNVKFSSDIPYERSGYIEVLGASSCR